MTDPMISELRSINEGSLYMVLMDFYKKYDQTPYIDNGGCLDG